MNSATETRGHPNSTSIMHISTNYPEPEMLFHFRALTATELDDIPEPTWFLEGLMYCNSVAMLYGKSGSYKSFLALDWALSSAAGQTEWHGLSMKPGPVVYVAAEGADWSIKRRKQAWETYMNASVGDNLLVLLPCEPLNITKPQCIEPLMRQISLWSKQPNLVVFDTLNQSAVGINENDSGATAEFIAAAKRVSQAWDATALIIHHIGKKGSDARGSSAIIAGVDTGMSMIKQNKTSVRLSSAKERDAEDFSDMPFRFTQVRDSGVLVPTGRRAIAHCRRNTPTVLNLREPESHENTH